MFAKTLVYPMIALALSQTALAGPASKRLVCTSPEAELELISHPEQGIRVILKQIENGKLAVKMDREDLNCRISQDLRIFNCLGGSRMAPAWVSSAQVITTAIGFDNELSQSDRLEVRSYDGRTYDAPKAVTFDLNQCQSRE